MAAWTLEKLERPEKSGYLNGQGKPENLEFCLLKLLSTLEN